MTPITRRRMAPRRPKGQGEAMETFTLAARDVIIAGIRAGVYFKVAQLETQSRSEKRRRRHRFRFRRRWEVLERDLLLDRHLEELHKRGLLVEGAYPDE